MYKFIFTSLLMGLISNAFAEDRYNCSLSYMVKDSGEIVQKIYNTFNSITPTEKNEIEDNTPIFSNDQYAMYFFKYSETYAEFQYDRVPPVAFKPGDGSLSVRFLAEDGFTVEKLYNVVFDKGQRGISHSSFDENHSIELQCFKISNGE
ncbi:MAG: hypothetical protein HOE90_07830 [Bacteriovoracaceae bacterium]|jgi:hypothetical protein|nr:hypothetical protein [Bacteriovoracaceae bacterium]